MQRLALALSLVLSTTGTLGCSDSGSDDGGGEETGGSGGSATGGSSTGGSSTGGSTTGGSSGTSTGGSSTGGMGGSGTGGSSTGGTGGAGGSGGGGFTKRGICGQKGEAVVTTTEYNEGVATFYMVSHENVEEGLLDQYICEIRYTVTRVGPVESPAGCADANNELCDWTHKVRFSNPTVVTNENGACEANEFVWDAAFRTEYDGTELSFGYFYMFEGHDSVVMTPEGAPAGGMWRVLGRASWDMDEMGMGTGAFSYDNRLGNCRY